VIAAGALLVAAVDIVSAVMPTLTDRYDLFQAMLPMGAYDVARSLTFAAGLALIWLSGGSRAESTGRGSPRWRW